MRRLSTRSQIMQSMVPRVLMMICSCCFFFSSL
nr:MAG TPA: hypothetical protein [Bacteriophage sp.]